MKIFSDDGRLFSSTEECRIYEEKQAQYAAMKAERFQEVVSAKDNYMRLLDRYNEDYVGQPLSQRESLWQQLIALYD